MRIDRVRDRRAGQALIEMTVALVALMVVVAGLIQIARLGRVKIDTLNEARAGAAGMMMGDNYVSVPPHSHYLADWTRGDDNSAYSADDEMVGAGTEEVRQIILAKARPSFLATQVPGNPLSTAMFSDPMADEFRIVHGNAKSEPVVLLPIVRHLLYGRDQIRLESDVYMVWTKGIY